MIALRSVDIFLKLCYWIYELDAIFQAVQIDIVLKSRTCNPVFSNEIFTDIKKYECN